MSEQTSVRTAVWDLRLSEVVNSDPEDRSRGTLYLAVIPTALGPVTETTVVCELLSSLRVHACWYSALAHCDSRDLLGPEAHIIVVGGHPWGSNYRCATCGEGRWGPRFVPLEVPLEGCAV